ncbi:MAG: MarR family transcriptional regulator [Hydrogenophaga sp.]|jgi:DNA-binding MarR family transcriptional regulator|uniref:MarR family winged helix-turn-helix transcriptional regulator n=1 Tax=Hydrogenophaga sp. TaxID=1904254 RepID=UPI00262E0DAF|nr:MarR family transcriptional regulator [Hydrogenophaga sp.]MCW5671368.1 MarR family transcriptional regulator [Hydrogenophaga sp.]
MTRNANTEVLDRLHSLMHGLRRHLQEAMRQDGEGLGPMEARCLAYFMRHDGATQSDLVQHSGRDKAQIARIVKALHERGLLHSRPDPDDGRSQRIGVTAEGQALQRKMQQHRARFEKAMVAGLDEKERAALLALLQRLQDNVGQA